MSAPYWQSSDGRIAIYHVEHVAVLPGLGGFDVAVTDAPFGIGHGKLGARKGGRTGPQRKVKSTAYHAPAKWDAEINPAWCSTLCSAAPIVAWFGSWKRRAQVEQAMPHPIRCEVIWAKDTHVGPPCPAAMRDERIWLFSRETFEGQHFETTVWDEPIIPTWEHRWHDNQKPERLMGRLIRWTCPPGAHSVDPFMGSGSTLVAAQRLGFCCTGIDASEEHCESAVVRLGGMGKRAAEPVGPLFGSRNGAPK